MATNKLTTKFCDHAPVGTHFDGESMYLLVQSDGKKYWRMPYKLHGRKRLLSFKAYPKVSLIEAREKRKAAKTLIEQGIDPIEYAKDEQLKHIREREKKAFEGKNTFEQIAKRLIDHKLKVKAASEEYCNRMLAMFKGHVFPELGHKPIEDIESAELLTLFKTIANKLNHGRPMTYSAIKLCQWSAEVFDFRHIEDNAFFKNPCRIVNKYLPKHKYQHMKRIEFKTLPDFIKKLNAYGGHVLTKNAIWLMLYTGVRQKSVRYAEIKDFDLEAGIWYRKPEKLKPHEMILPENILELPLPTQAIALLNEIKLYTVGELDSLMFPSKYSPHDRMSEATIGKAIKSMELEMVGHGLRGVVSTSLRELGYKPHVIESQLGHKQKAVEAAYNDSTYFKERVEMMQAWADYLDTFKNNKSSFNSA